MARVSEMMMARGSETGAPAQAKLRPAYGGYDPKSRAQSEPAQLYSAAAVPLTSAVADAPRHVAAPAAKVEPYAVADTPRHPAPAAKFEPYGGYDPKGRVLSTHASTTSEPVQTSRPAETSATFPFPPTPPAASKWAPYAGYDPLKRRTAAPAPEASAPSPPTEPTTTDATSEEPARVLPAKKWQPYGGYVPGRRKTEAAAQPMPWPSASHVVHASTHVPATSASADKASELWRQRMVQGLAAQSQTPQHVQAPAAMPLKDTHAAHAELEKSLVDQRFGPFAAADSEDDELSLAPSVNTLDAASPERAQRELDALGSIKNDFLARLDAAGARAAGRMDGHLRELAAPTEAANNIVNLYTPAQGEGAAQGPATNSLATADGLQKAHSDIMRKLQRAAGSPTESHTTQNNIVQTNKTAKTNTLTQMGSASAAPSKLL